MKNEQIDYEEYLMPESEKSDAKKEPCCECCLCCCCICYRDKKEISKTFYINKWRKYLSKESENTSAPFRILTNLWAHKNVINDLEIIRLNPNLVSEKGLRNDLEFYIPQLCTFLIFGEYEVVEEFLAFLCKACYASFFFAHRIIWFLKSLLNLTPMNDKIEYILQLIHAIFKSEKEKTTIESLYISNSKKYIEFIRLKNLNFLYTTPFESVNAESLNPTQSDIYHIYKTGRNLIEMFSKKLLEYAEELEAYKKKGEKYSNEFQWNFFVQPYEILISNYMLSQGIFNGATQVNEGETGNAPGQVAIDDDNELNADQKDVNLQSFLANVNFVDTLCLISERMMELPNDEQMAFLRKEISKINKILPGNVYIPFLKDSVRNYLICHIPVTEMKIFRTKTRAPYMLTFEIVRIDEIITDIIKKEKHKLNAKPSTRENETDDTQKNKHRSFSIAGIRSESNEQQRDELKVEKTVSYGKDSEKNFRSFIFDTNDEKKQISTTLMLLAESDIQLSKPVIIRNLDAKHSKKHLKGVEKIIQEDKEEIVESLPHENMTDLIKRRFTAVQATRSKTIGENPFLGEKSPNKKEFIFPKKEDGNIFLKEEDPQDFKPHAFRYKTIYSGKRNEIIKNDISEDGERFDQSQSQSESIISQVTSGEYTTIFGELIEAQTARIKKISPFGQLNTWRLFKAIVKSGEDLRQEQFATQLINEFHQIFKIEKTKCWVNPYEIIATGSNVGIIEMVPNSISIDQLKRKIGNNSLRHFFENYFGPTNTKRFRKAMHNFLYSLAGYSLVCYFLQIKDRHNANILLDNEGHLIHIDFGFLLSNAPGKGIKFENAPFKLTYETVECMGGVNSKYFTKFRKLLWKGFIALAKHYEKITILVEMMFCGHGNSLPCFQNLASTIDDLKARFCPRPNMKKVDYMKHVDSLIEQSIDNWRTRWYDKFQYYFQGIFY